MTISFFKQLFHRNARYAVVLLSLLSGCSDNGDMPDLGMVSGRVTLDGSPLVGAAVLFKPNEGGTSFGRTDNNGDYLMYYLRNNTGAIVGSHKVRITTATEEEPKEQVPERYNRKSELKKTVESGNNEFNFKLVTKGPGE